MHEKLLLIGLFMASMSVACFAFKQNQLSLLLLLCLGWCVGAMHSCLLGCAVLQVSLYACGNVLWTCSRVQFYDHELMEALLALTGTIAEAHAATGGSSSSMSSSKGVDATASSMDASVSGSMYGSMITETTRDHPTMPRVRLPAGSASTAPMPVAPHTANRLDADSTFMLTAVLEFYCCAVLNHRSQAPLTQLANSVSAVL